jgi:phosphomannomutase
MYKAIIFDLDGTLAESKQDLTLEMGEELKKLLAVMPVGVMSGADFPQFEKQLLPFIPHDSNFDNLYLFPTSGAEGLEYIKGVWHDAYDYEFDKEEKDKIIEALKEVEEKTRFVEGEPTYGERIEDRGEQITWSALGQEAPLGEKEAWDPLHEKRQVMRDELLRLIPEFEIGIGGSTSIDITHKGINKEDGITWLANKIGCSTREMAYVGDALFPGGNDEAAFATGIETKKVSGPNETKKMIERILESSPQPLSNYGEGNTD